MNEVRWSASDVSQSCLAATVERAAEAVLVLDATGSVLYANPAAREVTGYAPEELAGRLPPFLLNRADAEPFHQGLWLKFSQGEPWAGRITCARKDGSPFEADVALDPVRDAAGHVTRFVALIRDESRAANLEAQFRQAQKLETMGRLTAGIVHDFNNQLTVVQGYCDLVLRDLAADNPLRQGIQRISDAGRRAAALTQRLLSFSRRAPSRRT
jgi:two-component system cell cycle sensor histidine kinase/response regulator CckA